MKIDKSSENKIDKITEHFGRYQWFQLFTIWWCQIVITCNSVFMVFGGATNQHCTNETNSTSGETHCDEFTYDFYSFVPQWNLTNSLASVPTIITAVQLSGTLVGSLIGGHIADRYGRKLNTWISLSMTMVFVFVSAFSPNWPVMTAFRFVIGLAIGCYDSSAIILMMEWVDNKTRLKVQVSLDCVNSVAFCWFSFLAWLCKDYKTLTFACSLQCLPSVIAFVFLMETPRWCILHKKFAELNKNLISLKKWNGKHCKVDGDFSYLYENNTKINRTSKANYLDLFATKTLTKNSLMLIYSFFVTGSVGYMLIFNVGNLIGNIFLNFALLGTVNIIAAAITVLVEHVLKFGRRSLHQICLNGVWVFLTVIVILYACDVQEQYSALLVASALLGSMFSFPLWPVCNLYSGELFPTKIRNMASGAGSMAARTGGMVAPLILYMMIFWNPLPFLIVASMCICNVILAYFFLPETRHCDLPEEKAQLDLLKSTFIIDEKF